MEDFFGGAMPGSNYISSSHTPIHRDIRRGVWSSSLQEEDEWVDALLSLSAGHDSGFRHDAGCGRAEDVAYNATDTPKGEIPIICNTEIPKVIHFIWLGKKSLPSFPFLAKGLSLSSQNAHTINDNRTEGVQNDLLWNECMQSWKNHHCSSRGWKIHLWTERDIIDTNDAGNHEKESCNQQSAPFKLNTANMHNSQGYMHAIQHQHYGMASDILRLEILNKFGGVYIDIDYWCVDSLDDIITRANSDTAKTSNMNRVQFFCGASNVGCVELNNGLMACRKGGHPILWKMMNSIHGYFKAIMMTPPVLPQIKQQESIASLLSSFLDSTTADALESSIAGKDDASPMEVIENTGPGLLTRSVCRWLVRNDDTEYVLDSHCANQSIIFDASQMMVLSSCVFHPFPNHIRNILISPMEVDSQVKVEMESKSSSTSSLSMLEAFVHTRETKAIHLWGCSWQ